MGELEHIVRQTSTSVSPTHASTEELAYNSTRDLDTSVTARSPNLICKQVDPAWRWLVPTARQICVFLIFVMMGFARYKTFWGFLGLLWNASAQALVEIHFATACHAHLNALDCPAMKTIPNPVLQGQCVIVKLVTQERCAKVWLNTARTTPVTWPVHRYVQSYLPRIRSNVHAWAATPDNCARYLLHEETNKTTTERL